MENDVVCGGQHFRAVPEGCLRRPRLPTNTSAPRTGLRPWQRSQSSWEGEEICWGTAARVAQRSGGVVESGQQASTCPDARCKQTSPTPSSYHPVGEPANARGEAKKKDVISHERPLLNDCLQGERWKRSRLLQRRHRGLCCLASSALLLIRAHPSQCFYSLVFHTPLKAHILCWLSQCFVSYIFQAEFSACCLSC